jgi:hypothetical protein
MPDAIRPPPDFESSHSGKIAFGGQKILVCFSDTTIFFLTKELCRHIKHQGLVAMGGSILGRIKRWIDHDQHAERVLDRIETVQ